MRAHRRRRALDFTFKGFHYKQVTIHEPNRRDHLHVVHAAARLENVRYAIRDMAVLAEQLAREGKTILPLNIGDPLNFDFRTPPHLIAAVEKAMRDGRNGYAPSLGIPEAVEAIRAEAERKGFATFKVSS